MIPASVLYHGRDEPPPQRVQLYAGPLSLIYQAGDLRTIKLGEREVLRRIYVAVRDRNWGTVPMVLSNVRMQVAGDAFHIACDAEHIEGDIDFVWKGTIDGDGQGTIVFVMDGLARSTFWRNRIGFCVLHPMRECAGQPCTVEKVDGAAGLTVEYGAFPRYIAPHQPFREVRAIAHAVLPGVQAEVRLAGDVFEMEDQRNWSDASFKTYCTPLDLPLPVEVREGTRIRQSVTLTLVGQAPARLVKRQTANGKRQTAGVKRQIPAYLAELEGGALTFAVGAAPGGPMPRIGLGVASHGQLLSERELARLAALHLAHLRVDLHLSRPGYEAALRRAADEAHALGASLEVALHLSAAAEGELAALRALLAQVRPSVCAWLAFDARTRSTTGQLAELARSYLADCDPAARIGGGTDAYFAQLNRQRPPADVLDLVCWSINPQVHAFDDASLVETLQTQAVIVESARQFAGGRPLAVTPLTLKPRFHSSATGPERVPPAGALPAQVDVRQMSLFGAGWTAGSLKYLSESGVYSVTCYETSGWRGVMERESGSPLPDVFRSLPGSVYPLYHVLADVGDLAGGEVVPAQSSDPLRADGLAVRKGDRVRVLLANLTAGRQQVTVQGLAPRVQLCYLDERNAEQAMRSAERFRAQEGESAQTAAGTLECTLLPYAVLRIDAVQGCGSLSV